MLKCAGPATSEHFSLTVFRQTGQVNRTFSALALAGFQVVTFPTHAVLDLLEEDVQT
jgi:hypothetical protein